MTQEGLVFLRIRMLRRAWWSYDVRDYYGGDVHAISASNLHEDHHQHGLPEHGPCLVDGITTVDASQTTQVRIDSSFATAGHTCGALLDTSSRTAFINSNDLDTVMNSGTATGSRVVTASNLSWAGFGKSQWHKTPKTTCISMHLYHDTVPAASLAVRGHVVLAKTTQQPLQLGLDSFMRYDTRVYYVFEHRPLDDRGFGAYSLTHHNSRSAAAYVHNPRARSDNFRLRFAL